MDKKEIGKKIMALRTARGWAQYKLATESGISPSYIRALEKGEKCAIFCTVSDFLRECSVSYGMEKYC